MSTILGPLQENVRIQFVISFIIPDTFSSSVGNAVITDVLPSGLSLYLNSDSITDDKNSVKIGGTVLPRNKTVLSNGYIIRVNGETVTLTIASATLQTNLGSTLTATIDTFINSSMTTSADQSLNNTATAALGMLYEGTSQAIPFTIVKTGELSLTIPSSIEKVDGKSGIIELSFTAPASSEDFTYYIEADFGSNMIYAATADTPAIGYIESTSGSSFTVNADTSGTNPVFSFTNTTDMTSKTLLIQIKATTQNMSSAGTSISFTPTLSLGSAIGVESVFSIDVTDARTLNVTKTIAEK